MSALAPVTIHVLRCGTMTVSRDTPVLYRRNYYLPSARALTPMADRLELPVFSFLIRHPAGNILVDTGWPRCVSPCGVYDAGAAASVLGHTLASYYHPLVRAGEAIDERLDALGLSPSDIDYLLLTHLDPDHVAALGSLSGVRHILCSQEEYWWSCRTIWRLRQPKSLWMTDRLETFYFKGSSYGPGFWSLDFFGDASLMLVHLPGHTDGMYGLVVSRGSRFALLAADAVYSSSMALPGFGFNPVAQRKSIDWLSQKRQEAGCAAFLPSHDSSLSDCVIEL